MIGTNAYLYQTFPTLQFSTTISGERKTCEEEILTGQRSSPVTSTCATPVAETSILDVTPSSYEVEEALTQGSTSDETLVGCSPSIEDAPSIATLNTVTQLPEKQSTKLLPVKLKLARRSKARCDTATALPSDKQSLYDTKTNTCLVCKKVYKKLATLKDHVNKHLGEYRKSSSSNISWNSRLTNLSIRMRVRRLWVSVPIQVIMGAAQNVALCKIRPATRA